jgi:hypothetical protein
MGDGPMGGYSGLSATQFGGGSPGMSSGGFGSPGGDPGSSAPNLGGQGTSSSFGGTNGG